MVRAMTRIGPEAGAMALDQEVRRLVRERYISADELAACEPAEHRPD